MRSNSGLASKNIVARLCNVGDKIDSDYARQAVSSIKAVGAFRALGNLSPPPPGLYSDPLKFANDWMFYNFLRKYPDLPGSTVRARMEKTVSGWISAESRCFSTNRKFEGLLCGTEQPTGNCGPVSTVALLVEAQRQIARILGPFDRKKLLEECKWSKGASATLRRGASLATKHSNEVVATSSALKYVEHQMRRDPLWAEAYLGIKPDGLFSLNRSFVTIVQSSRTVCVPKTAYTDRTIAAEPLHNGFLQQGFGRWLRYRLMKWGCNLDDQSINQEAARRACFSDLCTLDLESASDTVSFQLVKFLLPYRFFQYLSDLRCVSTDIGKGKIVRLEKFSSMGNAFTFELESLIFLALGRACDRLTGATSGTLVYGDDIVCSALTAESLVPLLEYCGFRLNKSKSFLDGPFYESCGKHWFMGVDVTPLIQDEKVCDVASSIRFHNRLVRWSYRVYGKLYAPCLRPFWDVDWPMSTTYRTFLTQEDTGYIVPRSFLRSEKFCVNRGYRLTCLVEVGTHVPTTSEIALYAYKLRRFSYSNILKDGRAADPGKEKRRTIVRWTWLSSGVDSP